MLAAVFGRVSETGRRQGMLEIGFCHSDKDMQTGQGELRKRNRWKRQDLVSEETRDPVCVIGRTYYIESNFLLDFFLEIS